MRRISLSLVAALCLIACGAAFAKSASKAKVDLNTASQAELQALPGVSKATATKIIAGRPYASIDDLAKAGISSKTIEKIRADVTVGSPNTASSTTTASKGSSTAPPLVDLNKASAAQIQGLPGVGKSTAKKIIAGRPYKSVDDLSKAGVSAKTLKKIRPLVTVGQPAANPSQTASATPTPTPTPAPTLTPQPAAVPAAKPQPSPTASTTTSSSSHGKKQLEAGQTININTASLEELELLPGIGAVKGQAIIDGRPYARPEDVMKVKGIKQGTFSKIKDFITVN